MTRRTRRVAAATLAAVASTGAGAQARPAAPLAVQRPAAPEIVLLPDGAYQLTLTPASRDQRTLPGAQAITLGASVTHAGSAVTVTTADGMTLHGSASASHLKVSGVVQASTLTLELGGSGASASGTFLLAGRAGHELTGTAVVAPPPHAMARTSKPGGCHGFWDCVKAITGYDWSVFGD